MTFADELNDVRRGEVSYNRARGAFAEVERGWLVVQMVSHLCAAENGPEGGAHGVGDAEVEHPVPHLCVVAKHEGEELGVGESSGGGGDERRFERKFVELRH